MWFATWKRQHHPLSTCQAYGSLHYIGFIYTVWIDVKKCHRLGQLVKNDEMCLILVNPMLHFEIWEINFVGPFPKQGGKTRERYIIIAINYLIKCAVANLVGNYIEEVASKVIYENIITRFRCPLALTINQGKDFMNITNEVLMNEFLINHNKFHLTTLNQMG